MQRDNYLILLYLDLRDCFFIFRLLQKFCFPLFRNQEECNNLCQKLLQNVLLSGKFKQWLNITQHCRRRLIFCMQTQNYVYYMHFLVLKESEQKSIYNISKCTKVTYNVMVGYQHASQNAPMSILAQEMNSLSQFCYSLIYLMQLLF